MPSGSRVREAQESRWCGERDAAFGRRHAKLADPVSVKERERCGGKKPTIESVKGTPWRGTRP